MIIASVSDNIQSTSYALGIIVILVGGFVTLRSKASREYKELAVAQGLRLKFLEDAHTENTSLIKHLGGQVDVLKNVPLQELSATNKQISTALSSLVDTNLQILANLRASATTLATGTATRARAVRQVKTDLETT